MAFAVVATSIAVGSPRTVAPVTYTIDVNHSRLIFKVRHFVSKVEGRFDKWSGTIVTDSADFRTGKVDVAIQTASINTNNTARDNDLRSNNFFLADSFPVISFHSTRVEMQGSALTVAGDLTMRGVTRPVVLKGEFMGRVSDAPGRERIGFEASTTVNRLDYGVKWNRILEGGGAMLGDDVTIEMSIEAIRTTSR